MYITLAGKDVEAARLRRIGGELRFNDGLIPVGAVGCLVHSDGNRSSFVLADAGGLVPIYTTDINDQTFSFMSDLTDVMADCIFRMFRKREIVIGEPLSYQVGDRLSRTGQPYVSSWTDRHSVGQVATVTGVLEGKVWFDEFGPRPAQVPLRYMTDAYFAPVPA